MMFDGKVHACILFYLEAEVNNQYLQFPQFEFDVYADVVSGVRSPRRLCDLDEHKSNIIEKFSRSNQAVQWRS